MPLRTCADFAVNVIPCCFAPSRARIAAVVEVQQNHLVVTVLSDDLIAAVECKPIGSTVFIRQFHGLVECNREFVGSLSHQLFQADSAVQLQGFFCFRIHNSCGNMGFAQVIVFFPVFLSENPDAAVPAIGGGTNQRSG